MSVLAELEGLQQKRQSYAEAIAKIDDELALVRLALGMPSGLQARALKATEQHQGKYRSSTTTKAQSIRDALTVRQPQTLQELAKAIGCRQEGLHTVCRSLVQQERLTCVERWRGKASGYSLGRLPIERSAQYSPFDSHKHLSTPTSTAILSDEAGTTADTDSAAATLAGISDEAPGSMPLNSTTGPNA